MVIWLFAYPCVHLHSTMYLFQLITPRYKSLCNRFTFHYVSISTMSADTVMKNRLIFTFHYVSISTFRVYDIPVMVYQFTFHYVSISTPSRSGFFSMNAYLHSTMYLFQRTNESDFRRRLIYLHSTMYLFQPLTPSYYVCSPVSFTFHYVSISTLYILLLTHINNIYIPLCIYFNEAE